MPLVWFPGWWPNWVTDKDNLAGSHLSATLRQEFSARGQTRVNPCIYLGGMLSLYSDIEGNLGRHPSASIVPTSLDIPVDDTCSSEGTSITYAPPLGQLAERADGESAGADG
jgi:hypothetical protein